MSFSDLQGRRVLVVEADYDQAQAMALAIERHGADVVGPYPDVEGATLALQRAEVDAADLDVRLSIESVFCWRIYFVKGAFPSFSSPDSAETCFRSGSVRSK